MFWVYILKRRDTYRGNQQMRLSVIKKIAKQGKNLVIIIPKNLHSFLESGELVEININKIELEKRK